MYLENFSIVGPDGEAEARLVGRETRHVRVSESSEQTQEIAIFEVEQAGRRRRLSLAISDLDLAHAKEDLGVDPLDDADALRLLFTLNYPRFTETVSEINITRVNIGEAFSSTVTPRN
jgi:hypothetical protein